MSDIGTQILILRIQKLQVLLALREHGAFGKDRIPSFFRICGSRFKRPMALIILCNSPLKGLTGSGLLLIQVLLAHALIGRTLRLCLGTDYLPKRHTLVFRCNVYLMSGLLDPVFLYPLLHLVIIERGLSGGKCRFCLLQLCTSVSIIYLRNHFSRSYGLVVVHVQRA